jgi:hypothetical protein
MLEEQSGYEKKILNCYSENNFEMGKHLKVDEARILRRAFVMKINSRVP